MRMTPVMNLPVPYGSLELIQNQMLWIVDFQLIPQTLSPKQRAMIVKSQFNSLDTLLEEKYGRDNGDNACLLHITWLVLDKKALVECQNLPCWLPSYHCQVVPCLRNDRNIYLHSWISLMVGKRKMDTTKSLTKCWHLYLYWICDLDRT